MPDAPLAALLAELGIDAGIIEARGLRVHRTARTLRYVGLGSDGRDKFLVPAAGAAWIAMRDAAARDGIALQLISAFRSIEFQAALIRGKLAKGLPIAEILRLNAPPGYSEHHSGRAVDVGDGATPALDEAFEATPAFAWLVAQAARFGFRLSYPRDNGEGYRYEPWHWCWHPEPR